MRRTGLLAALNGGGIAVSAGLMTLATVATFFSWSALAAGVGVTLGGLAEAWGSRLLFLGRKRGFRWAAGGQVIVFLVLLLYSTFQLLTLSGDAALAALSPDLRELLAELYGLDPATFRDLLEGILRATYCGVMLTSLLYQGGLYVFYRRRESRSEE